MRFRLDLLAAQQAARRALAEMALASSRPEPLPTASASGASRGRGVSRRRPRVASSKRSAPPSATHGRETDDLQRLTAAAAADPDAAPDPRRRRRLRARPGSRGVAGSTVARSTWTPCCSSGGPWRPPVSPRRSPRDRARAQSGLQGAEPHRCPACGSPPSIARLRRADGRRLLTCGLCGSEWEAMRLACACCGDEGPRVARRASPGRR